MAGRDINDFIQREQDTLKTKKNKYSRYTSEIWKVGVCISFKPSCPEQRIVFCFLVDRWISAPAFLRLFNYFRSRAGIVEKQALTCQAHSSIAVYHAKWWHSLHWDSTVEVPLFHKCSVRFFLFLFFFKKAFFFSLVCLCGHFGYKQCLAELQTWKANWNIFAQSLNHPVDSAVLVLHDDFWRLWVLQINAHTDFLNNLRIETLL